MCLQIYKAIVIKVGGYLHLFEFSSVVSLNSDLELFSRKIHFEDEVLLFINLETKRKLRH